jgi:hypothetical protein
MKVARRVVAACCLAALAAACGPTLDVDDLETQLADQLGQEFVGTAWQVTCPGGVRPEAGATFECEATGDDGTSLTVEVIQGETEGSVTWRIVGTG